KENHHNDHEKQVLSEKALVGPFLLNEPCPDNKGPVHGNRQAGVERNLPVHVEKLKGQHQGGQGIMKKPAASKALFEKEHYPGEPADGCNLLNMSGIDKRSVLGAEGEEQTSC